MRRFGSLIAFAILSGLLALSHAESSSHGQQSRPRVIRGSETPELIPTFMAWRAFVDAVDTFYRQSASDSYLAKDAALTKVDGYALLQKEVNGIIADFATYANRELVRLENKRNELQQLDQMGRLKTTSQGYQQRQLDLIREEVDVLKRASESLRDSLVALDSRIGAAVWNQLICFCNSHIKRNMSHSSDDTPGDRAVEAEWRRFDPKMIEVPYGIK